MKIECPHVLQLSQKKGYSRLWDWHERVGLLLPSHGDLCSLGDSQTFGIVYTLVDLALSLSLAIQVYSAIR